MPIVFPTSPTSGQVFSSGGRSWVWTGTSWDTPTSFSVPGVSANNITSGTLASERMAPGSVVQVVYATTGFVNQTINSATPVLINGLSASITPKFANSAILIEAVVAASWSYVSSVHVFRNGSNLIPAHGGNSQSGGTNALWTHYQSSQETDRPNQLFPFPVLYQDLPNTTTTLTYDLRANSGWAGGAVALYINNRLQQDMLSSSHMKLTEIVR